MSELALQTTVLPRPIVRAGRDLIYLLSGLPLGILTFTVAITGLSLALGLAITLAGIPVLLATLYAGRWMADLERWRAAWALEVPVQGHERAWTGGFWQRFKMAATDAAAWREQAWALLLMPFGTLGFTAAVTAWSTALGLATSPLWYWALPAGGDDQIDLLDSTALGWSALRVAIGVALIPVAYGICRGLTEATAQTARRLLG